MWYIGTNVYSSALKRKGTLKNNINMEDIMYAKGKKPDTKEQIL